MSARKPAWLQTHHTKPKRPSGKRERRQARRLRLGATVTGLIVAVAMITGCGSTIAHPVLHERRVAAKEARVIREFCSYGRHKAASAGGDALEIYVEQCEWTCADTTGPDCSCWRSTTGTGSSSWR